MSDPKKPLTASMLAAIKAAKAAKEAAVVKPAYIVVDDTELVVHVCQKTFESRRGAVCTVLCLIPNGFWPDEAADAIKTHGLRWSVFDRCYSGFPEQAHAAIDELRALGATVVDVPDLDAAKAAAAALPQVPMSEALAARRAEAKSSRRPAKAAAAANTTSIVTMPDGRRAVVVAGAVVGFLA